MFYKIADLDSVIVFNAETGEKKMLDPIENKGWSAYPPFFVNGTFFFFMTGEEDNEPE